MQEKQPVKIGVAGLGGYAKVISQVILDEGPTVQPEVEMVAACDPELSRHAEQAEVLRSHGVTLYDSYEAMLAHPGLEGVWLPVPIDLHVPFAEQALDAGLAVMLEKPVAGTVDEIDQLITARDKAGLPLLVGFQHIYAQSTLPLKQRLLSGELGQVRGATVHGCWPRDTAYFGRASWAGALRRGETWVLDSPVNNAMAHFVNQALFLLGDDEASSARPTHLAAELYRAAAIENYDTASIRVTLGRPEPIDLSVLFTHASASLTHPTIQIHTERGGVCWTEKQATVTCDGQTETLPQDPNIRRSMLETLARTLRGESPETSVASLEVARVHTTLVNASSQASAITPVPEEHIIDVPTEQGVIRSIPGIETIFDRCAAEQKMLHESHQLPFTVPAAGLDLVGYNQFAGPATG